MKNLQLTLTLICSTLFLSVLHGQSSYAQLSNLKKSFYMQESFEGSQKVFDELKNYMCMVEYYPTMAITAIEQGYRPDAIQYLYDAFRYGYRAKDLQKGHPEAYIRFSQLTIDSLLQYINLSKTIAFNWQAYLELNDYFTEIDANRDLANVDSNARELVVPLRNLLYQYMRKKGFPSDCEVGYGMQIKASVAVMDYSAYLHDFEFEELDALLFKALNNNQITLNYYVFVVDYYYFINGRTSKFGSLETSGNAELEKYIASHLQEINSARQKLGLAKITSE